MAENIGWDGGQGSAGDGAKVEFEKKGVADKPHAVVHLLVATALYPQRISNGFLWYIYF